MSENLNIEGNFTKLLKINKKNIYLFGNSVVKFAQTVS